MDLTELKQRILNARQAADATGELASVAAILPADYAAAREMWQRYAPARYRGLLDGGGFTFDPVRQQNRTRDGTYLPAGKIKELAILVVDRAKQDQSALALGMLGLGMRTTPGNKTVEKWATKAAGAIKSQYVALAALAAGGFKWLTKRILAVVAGKPSVAKPSLAFSLSRLKRFALQIVSGEAGTPEAIAARSATYADTGYGVFEEARRQSHIDAKDENGETIYDSERNILDDEAAHCHTTEDRVGCPELTKRGWVPIGTLVPIGARQCLFRCRCHIDYSKKSKAKAA